jgi:flavin reductase (DIM6/NTAB) family NADH-FMN oxidoreductase RutF
MRKVTLGPQTLLYPMPALLVGANVDGKPNFMAAAWCGIANSNPPMLSVALQHHRYTYKGIKENGTFSMNVPSVDLVKETDYCGVVSGAKEDKAAACRFNLFYGQLLTAPLIMECPVNLECRVVHILNLGSHAFIIGEIKETHVTEDCLTEGEPDIHKIKPFAFSSGLNKEYYALGDMLASAFSIGFEIKKRKID